MVEYGNSCYIHIPKTGGSWITKVLQQRDDTVLGKAHHMPHNWDKYDDVWTVVRRPDKWLDSFYRWAHRTWPYRSYPGLNPLNYGNNTFQSFCWRMKTYVGLPFKEFVLDVTHNYPGIIGWLFNTYIPPGVTAYTLEDAWIKLSASEDAQIKGAACDPYKVKPVNVNPMEPLLDDATSALIFRAEIKLYSQFEWAKEIPYAK